jgi:hypothetical protein
VYSAIICLTVSSDSARTVHDESPKTGVLMHEHDLSGLSRYPLAFGAVQAFICAT